MWRAVVRILSCVLVFVSTVSADSPSVSSDRWTVQSRSGDVAVSGAETTEWQYPGAGQVLDAPFYVKTGATGEVILIRGEDVLLVSPDSRIEVRAVELSPDSGLVTRILQALGSLVYQVEKRPRQNFEVHTPYIVSVVKGTTFTISVTERDAAVSLDEGSLEVFSKDGLHRVRLKPGEIARHEKGMGAIEVRDGALKQSQWGKWHPANTRSDNDNNKRTRLDVTRWLHAPGTPGHPNGMSDTAPGLAGTAPGLAGTAPGLAGTAPGLAGTAPGLGGSAPGQAGTAPGLLGITPGLSGAAPGRNK